MRSVAIIQARNGSKRLPGKVLQPVFNGRTLLDVMLERVRACRKLDEIVVAVPDLSSDDPVAEAAKRCGASIFRGSEEDVLDRYLGAARRSGAELVVRLTSDCPLIDPAIVDLHVERMLARWTVSDFVTNMMRQTYPLGLAVEAMPVDVLIRLDRLSSAPYLREHVTALAYEEPQLFRIEHVCDTTDRSHMRWTVDYPEDLQFVRTVYQKLYQPGKLFSFPDVLRLVTSQPDIAALNAKAEHQSGCAPSVSRIEAAR